MTTKAEEVKKMSKAEDEKKEEKAEGEEKKEQLEEVKKKEKAEEEKKEKEKAEFEKAKQEKKKKKKLELEEELKKRGVKMALWCTRNSKPLIIHGELDPIMETLGFVPVPLFPGPTTTNFDNVTVFWKKYHYSGASTITTRSGAFPSRPLLTRKTPAPRPRLPYPRIDGLHIFTYRAFMDAVKFYHNKDFVSDHLHIGALPIDPIHDLHMSWVYMFAEVRNFSVFYREGTLDVSPRKHYPLRSSEHGKGKEIIEKDDYEDDLKITMGSMDNITLSDKKNNGSSCHDHEATETP